MWDWNESLQNKVNGKEEEEGRENAPFPHIGLSGDVAILCEDAATGSKVEGSEYFDELFRDAIWRYQMSMWNRQN